MAVAGGVAYATIPDSAGVIHGCYSKSGSLRVIDPSKSQHCAAAETPIQWNQTGPQGLPGAPGTNGATGTAGPAGPQGVPGTAAVYTSADGHGSFDTFLDWVTVGSLDVPAGRYAVTASTWVHNNNNNENIICQLFSPYDGRNFGNQAIVTVFSQGSLGWTSMTLPVVGAIDLPTASTIQLRCMANAYAPNPPDGGGGAGNTYISAVTVGTIAAQ